MLGSRVPQRPSVPCATRAAILSADVVGYSRLAEDEAATVRKLEFRIGVQLGAIRACGSSTSRIRPRFVLAKVAP